MKAQNEVKFQNHKSKGINLLIRTSKSKWEGCLKFVFIELFSALQVDLRAVSLYYVDGFDPSAPGNGDKSFLFWDDRHCITTYFIIKFSDIDQGSHRNKWW